MLRTIVAFTLLASSLDSMAATPNCTGPDSWASNMAYAQLKNAGLVTPTTVDFAKTQSKLLASEKIGKDLYRQIHKVTFFKTDKTTIVVITSNEASSEECSMSGVEVFVISQQLGDEAT